METNCCYDSGDSTTHENLKERIREMRSDLNLMKKQLYLEKYLLNRQKQEILGQGLVPESNVPEYKTQQLKDSTESTLVLNKEYLKDIESKCEKELDKLQLYILNMNQIRSNWIKMRQADDQLNSLKPIEKTKQHISILPEQKLSYHKGKVFYVDSALSGKS